MFFIVIILMILLMLLVLVLEVDIEKDLDWKDYDEYDCWIIARTVHTLEDENSDGGDLQQFPGYAKIFWQPPIWAKKSSRLTLC
ncbi:hypothetical protein CISIN_1g034793mg [Citrus sinensis]|uniref:Uncharacterized protein n=1 Tax=Citrus sinensis TaxID=2711 RepID=A0A067ERX4_CITSI|nr:hypothetical protein CISIN_1g034793mg [Citrus sinensis]